MSNTPCVHSTAHQLAIMSFAASAADARNALSVQVPFKPTQSRPAPSASTPSVRPAKATKPDEISRELYNLIGPSAPSLVVQHAKPQAKRKSSHAGKSKVEKWCVDHPLSHCHFVLRPHELSPLLIQGVENIHEFFTARQSATQSLGKS